MRPSIPLLVLSVVAACGSKEEAAKETAKPFSGPMPVGFGDCAGPTVAFVSGPRPLPFTLEEAVGVWASASLDDPPPPPEDEPSGGTGTAMALEEGKMGKRDSDRAVGQYRMKETADDPQRAREQAIEAARVAKILGSTSLQQGGAFASLTGTGDIATGFDDANIYGGLLGNEVGELDGGGFGYGRSGFGPGGGGTGWGTIGSGKYGTIGHGSGTGSGYGGRGGTRGRTSPVPSVSIGQPNANGDLDKAIIRRYIKRNISKLQYCYEKQLLAKPRLAGTVSASFFIAPTGHVVSSSASGVDPEVASCVAGVIKEIEFPKPKRGGGVQVNYPFTFKIAGGDGGSPDPAPAAKASGSGSGSAAPVDSAAVRELFRAGTHGAVVASSYTPGAANPLRPEAAALTECFRATPTHHGAIVVGLTYDGAGAVATSTVYGLDDAGANACVAAAAKRAKRGPTGPAAQRCPVAFGVTPTAELTAIDVGATVKLAGKDLGTAIADGRDLPPLVEAIKARVAIAVAPSAPIIVVHPPLVIRPVDTTTLANLLRVMRSVVYGGDDFVLAARRGTAWPLLSSMSPPTVPVPFGTGGRWSPLKTMGSGPGADDERVVLSVLVTKDKHVWLGLSRVDEFQDLAPGPDQPAKLAAKLKDYKLSAFFADRTDVEVAGDDDATYGDLVPLIDAAVAVGFKDWRVTSAHALAATPQR